MQSPIDIEIRLLADKLSIGTYPLKRQEEVETEGMGICRAFSWQCEQHELLSALLQCEQFGIAHESQYRWVCSNLR